MREYKACTQLSPYIQAYRIIESHDEIVNRIVPNTSFALAFRLKGHIINISDADRIAFPFATFTGLRHSVRLINYAPGSAALIVLFRESRASSFFNWPLHELFEESVPLDTFLPKSKLSDFQERLGEAVEDSSLIYCMEQFLKTIILKNQPDLLVEEAISKIHASNGLIKIRELAKSLYKSQYAFEKRFRKMAGATPKQFAKIVRMQSLIRNKTSSDCLVDVALENGYYDQPHFNKDFKLFTGQTPTEFFTVGPFW